MGGVSQCLVCLTRSLAGVCLKPILKVFPWARNVTLIAYTEGHMADRHFRQISFVIELIKNDTHMIILIACFKGNFHCLVHFMNLYKHCLFVFVFSYYSLEVSYFKSALDRKLLESLWNKYWVNTLSSSSLLTVSKEVFIDIMLQFWKLQNLLIQLHQYIKLYEIMVGIL